MNTGPAGSRKSPPRNPDGGDGNRFVGQEPIAIVGMACRFPGADGIPAFWRLLEGGVNAVQEGEPGSGVGRIGRLFPNADVQSVACRFGAYLDELDQFDATFFRISPVEAQLLDPQQRLMLETCWRALEDAGMDPERLRGSRTGVYAGISNNEYRNLILEVSDTAEPAASLYTVTGTSFNTAIGRVAFALGLEGPAMAVDTACSSSLVAMHQAVTGLQRGESDLALAGGVHTILSGRLLELRANAGMLSPDGRCATFDAAANGYVRGEGCGIVVLKRLTEAQADGDRIWGVVRGTALNQDGASPGLTVPSGPAQEKCIEAALASAGLESAQVDYLEAHGTGTPVGDPIELEATAAAYGRGRDPERPLLIGSVKTNIGHLESAAGVAGVIKTILAMKHGVIPRHLHFRTPNPEMDWDRLPLQVTAEPTAWPLHDDHPPTAGVSGFGWSGTNAHVLLEGYGVSGSASAGASSAHWAAGAARPVAISMPESVAEPPRDGLGLRETRVLPVSGRSDAAVRELAGGYLAWLDERAEELASQGGAADPLLSDTAWTAGTGRSHFDHRAGVVFRDAASLRDGLLALAETDDGAGPGAASKVAFAYTGQASQWVGMGATLYASEPVFRAVLDRCDALLRDERGGASLLDVMFGRTGAAGDLDDPKWKQPAIYALECALTALWSSLGILPDVVLGHSLGEIAAAHTAEVLGLEEGLRFAAARGSLIGALPGEGAMAAVFAPASRVASALDEHNAATAGPGLSIAADNGAHQVVSGPVAAIEAITERFEAEEVRVRRLRKSPAYHSAMVEPALDDLEAALREFTFAPPSIPLVSNLSGRVVEPDAVLDASYWRRQAREPVAFRACIETLAELGVDAVVEIGPHSVLGPMTLLAWPESAEGSGPQAAVSSLRQPHPDVPATETEGAFVAAVAQAYEAGLPIRFEGLFAGESRRRISLPGYPFQRERHWVEAPKRRRAAAGHPLLGDRHESASGEVTFETEVFPTDPAWLDDHRVFGRLVAPGALYGAMAVSAAPAEGSSTSLALEDMQLHNPLVFPEEGSGDEGEEGVEGSGRKIQVLLDAAGDGPGRRIQVLSRGEADEEWTVHAEARIPSTPGARSPEASSRIDLEGLKADLAPADVSAFYRAKAGVGIDLGPSFRTLERVWSRPGEALGEVSFPQALGANGLDVHPLLLDGCFQVMGAARVQAGAEDGTTYLPFGWERLWLADGLPDRIVCHVRMRKDARSESADDESAGTAEVMAGDLRLYDPDGALVGELSGYTIKRATRAALLAAVEGVKELLYEVVWRDRALAPGMPPADFLTAPATVKAGSGPFTDYLAAEGVGAADRAALLEDLELLARRYAIATLDALGWERAAGAVVDSVELRQRLEVGAEHERLFRRLLEMLARSGVLEETNDGFAVLVGSGDPLPGDMPADPEELAARMAARYAHGSNEIGLFRRSANALPEVLRGRMDPLTLLFSSGEPTAADLYMKAPVARAANRMLADAIATLLRDMPAQRRLRVLEVGAGTGSATAAVLPELPEGRFDYTYTDISAGFFAEAESRFGGAEASIEYRVLDIENDPVEQGFDAHGYDLVIASNVLHATRYLEETLAHCRALLAPSGQLVALENLRGQGWLDLTFGQLDGWWRFADDYRPHHALASPAIWRQALGDADFGDVAVLGVDETDPNANPDRGVIVAQGPVEVVEAPGVWVLAADRGGVAAELAEALAARNQTVVLAGADSWERGRPARSRPEAGRSLSGRDARAPRGASQQTLLDGRDNGDWRHPRGASPHVSLEGKHDGTWMNPNESGSGVVCAHVELERRESWQSLLEELPTDAPLHGIVHLAALDGHGPRATTEEMAADAKRTAGSALALVQGIADADAMPAKGVWLVTRGAQVVEKERGGKLAGATLWGIGKVMAREAVHLQPRMIDLEPGQDAPLADLVNELMYPDPETHVAYRFGRRQAARLVRDGDGTDRLAPPDDSGWLLEPDAGGSLEHMRVGPLPARPVGPGDVRVAVEASGLNFWDVFRSIGLIGEGLLGGEFCGRILEVGSDVSTVAVGDLVVGLAFGTFGSETVTSEAMVAPAPAGIPVTELATMPTAFVSAVLSYDFSGLEPGERVLIHAGAGGVGLAAIQWAHAAGAEVFATASARKRAYLRSIGVKHVFDSRTTAFGDEILEATGGAGVDVVLNSLTGEGFIEASLSCLANGGRFVELARVDIWSEEEMAAARPDVAYHILKLDVLKEDFPDEPGDALRRVMKRLEAGEIEPIVHSRWSLTEAGPAMDFMRAARHIGKIVLSASPLETGRLRTDRTYLVTGGLGGIGCVVAEWLADRGAGAIVLNGRRAPDPEAEQVIASLRSRGVTVQVELADVTDAAALDAMLERMDRDLAPLGGVVHSVGVLSDAALGNQTWERFQTVLWPKMLGAWHLHRATMHRDLDLFVLFSSIAGVMGNPGQANHAAANAFLDQLAAHRRSLGLAGQAIAWGAWSGLGEAEEQRERIGRQLEASGTRWISPQQGLRAFDRLVRQDVTASVVAGVDWPVFADAVESRPPLIEELLAAETDTGSDAADGQDDVLSRLRVVPAEERENLLVSFLQSELQAVLRLPSAPAPTVGFFDLGMDSLMAVELRNRLNRAFSGEYTAPNTLVFDYPNVADLAGHLAGELGDAGGADAAPAPAAHPEPARSAEPGADGDRIAIVGMACRLPGAPDLAAFRRLLEEERTAVTDGRQDPADWDGVTGDPAAGEDAYRHGGFVEGIDRFDARFFGIRPIEARAMDPRQRLLLETSWQALEDAGIDPGALRGGRAGVYAGLGGSEYRDVIAAVGEDVGYLGTAASVAVGRVAFALGLAGPAVAVDMTCASSLAALHQAAASLERGEVDVALGGGVHAVLSPGVTKFMAEFGLLSASGRCRPFDAAADGFVRGEGCGMVVLKRLADAQSHGDRIWAVLRGSAVNQSGASAGLTVPNGPAQERVIEEALSRAGIPPSEVDYLETHGTGSEMGDPIEVRAAAAVYGRGRDADRPLLIGSVKPNIGHLESAAGVTSLIKVVLAMQEMVIPPQPDFRSPSPLIEWDKLPVRVASEATEWPNVPGRPPRAGVSAFGISGANAHAVVEGYGEPGGDSAGATGAHAPAGSARPVAVALPEPTEAPPGDAAPEDGLAARTTRLLPLSGKADEALRELAGRYLSWLDERAGELSAEDAASDPLLSDMAWTAGAGRSHFSHRAGVVFDDSRSLRERLQALVESEERPDPREATNVAFAYADETSQWVGMGEVLYESEPVVRAVLDRCDTLLRDERGASLLGVMFGRSGVEGVLDDPVWAQPAIYALQCALTALWSSVGVRPNIVVGHGVGEIAAAQAAGVFDPEAGLRLASARGALAGTLPEVGAQIAAVDDLDAVLEGVALAPLSRTFVSHPTGRVLEAGEALDPKYWRWQTREPRAFERCVPALADLGIDVIVEIGPQAVLGPTAAGVRPLSENGSGPDAPPVLLASLRRPCDDAPRPAPGSGGGFVEAVAGAYEAGLPVFLAGLFAGEARRRVSLPGYPFQRRRHWVKSPDRPAAVSPT